MSQTIPNEVRTRFLDRFGDLRPQGEAFLADIATSRAGQALTASLVRLAVGGNYTTAGTILHAAQEAGIVDRPYIACPECYENIYDLPVRFQVDEEYECPECGHQFPLYEHALFPLLFGLTEGEFREKTAAHVRQLDLRSEITQVTNALIERHGAEGALERMKALL